MFIELDYDNVDLTKHVIDTQIEISHMAHIFYLLDNQSIFSETLTTNKVSVEINLTLSNHSN